MSFSYMLDTDSVSFALRGQSSVAKRLVEHKPSRICLSSITLAELRYGADLRHSSKLHRLINDFVGAVGIASFDSSAAAHFGVIAAKLACKGSPIGIFDTLIAAHALSLDVILVTNNTNHFSRIPNLRIENWT